jgi:uncharacterized protein YciI
MTPHFSLVFLPSFLALRPCAAWLSAALAVLFFSGPALAGDKSDTWVRYVAQAVKTQAAAEAAPRAETVKWVQYPNVKAVNWSKPSTLGADKSNWVRFPAEKPPEQLAQLGN